MIKELVQLVDENNVATGVMEKLEAHRLGSLHRAISVLVFSTKGELLLQQRAPGKYHSSGLWSNTCCTHPRPGEKSHDAAVRRLKEEMNISCELFHQFNFLYEAPLGYGLIEHEYDEVYFGWTDMLPVPDRSEVSSWIYLTMDEIDCWLQEAPETFTSWFPILYDQVKLRL